MLFLVGFTRAIRELHLPRDCTTILTLEWQEAIERYEPAQVFRTPKASPMPRKRAPRSGFSDPRYGKFTIETDISPSHPVKSLSRSAIESAPVMARGHHCGRRWQKIPSIFWLVPRRSCLAHCWRDLQAFSLRSGSNTLSLFLITVPL